MTDAGHVIVVAIATRLTGVDFFYLRLKLRDFLFEVADILGPASLFDAGAIRAIEAKESRQRAICTKLEKLLTAPDAAASCAWMRSVAFGLSSPALVTLDE
jgi:hypothetical protein